MSLAAFIPHEKNESNAEEINRFYRPEVSYRLVHTKQCHNKKERS